MAIAPLPHPPILACVLTRNSSLALLCSSFMSRMRAPSSRTYSAAWGTNTTMFVRAKTERSPPGGTDGRRRHAVTGRCKLRRKPIGPPSSAACSCGSPTLRKLLNCRCPHAIWRRCSFEVSGLAFENPRARLLRRAMITAEAAAAAAGTRNAVFKLTLNCCFSLFR